MSRTQFPIRLAYALTIHKGQGQTLKKIIVELGKKEATLGVTFVALSRVKNVNDFLIHPFTLDRLKVSVIPSFRPRFAGKCSSAVL